MKGKKRKFLPLILCIMLVLTTVNPAIYAEYDTEEEREAGPEAVMAPESETSEITAAPESETSEITSTPELSVTPGTGEAEVTPAPELSVTPGAEETEVTPTPKSEELEISVSPGAEEAEVTATPESEELEISATPGAGEAEVTPTPEPEISVTPGVGEAEVMPTPKPETEIIPTPGEPGEADPEKPDTGNPGTGESDPSGSDAPGIDDGPSADAPVQSMPSDTVRPVIAVSSDGYGSGSTYCHGPSVTVTDDHLKSVTVSVTAKGMELSDEQSFTPSEGKVEINLGTYQISVNTMATIDVTITAEDSSSNTEIAQLRIAHSMGRLTRVVVNEATCTRGERDALVAYCTICGDVCYRVDQGYDKNVKGHTWGPEETITEEQCGGIGSITKKTCTVCGEVDIQTTEDYVPGGDHKWVTQTTKNGCEETNYSYEECSVCKSIRNRQEIKPEGKHEWSQYTIEVQPDCGKQTNGRSARECNKCGKREEITLYYHHTLTSPSRKTVEAPECEKAGKSARFQRCTTCGTELILSGSETVIPALGHQLAADDNDCTTGVHCTRCSQEITPPQEHNLTDAYDISGHWQKCANAGCIYTTQKEAHRNPPAVNDCTVSWKCEECGYEVVGQSSHFLTSGNWNSDDTYHWQTCRRKGCEYEGKKYVHTVATKITNCTVERKCTVCDKVFQPSQQHNWSETMSYTVGKHYYQCLNPNCGERKDVEEHHIQQSTDCTKGWRCADCGYEAIVGTLSHNFKGAPYLHDGTSHWQECENGICTVTSTPVPHSGGHATCRDLAVCEICGMSYGSLDKTSHTGGVEKEVNHRNPTTEQTGYTGDTVCLGCGEVIEEGTEIPKLQEEHQHNWVKTYDDTKSWEECTCGAVQNEIPHKLSEWKQDGESHWRVCDSCAYTTTKSVHAMNEEELDEDCSTPAHCRDCGYVMVNALEHKYASYAFDGEKHWQVCANEGCGVMTEAVLHTAADDKDCTTPLICDVCGYTMLAANTHDYSSEWKADDGGHYHECLNIGCGKVLREEHQAVEDDHLCTTAVICSICGFEMEKGAEVHNYGGDYLVTPTGHHQKCQNSGCVSESPEVLHYGGTATCVGQASCEVCGQLYGELNPDHHTGSVEIQNYKEPAVEEEGYSGDEVCTECRKVLRKGNILARLPQAHTHIFDLSDIELPYQYDDTHHWKECTCGVHSGSETHVFGDYEYDHTHHWRTCSVCGRTAAEEHIFEDGKCRECGAEVEVHTHEYQWNSDGSMHWQECECGEVLNRENHRGGEATCTARAVCEVCGEPYGSISGTHTWSDASSRRTFKEPSCTETGYKARYCTECGAEYTEDNDREIIPALGHDYAENGNWLSDDVFHWQVCTREGCGNEGKKSAHVINQDFDCTTELRCDVCGRVVEEARQHNWSSELTYTAENHYYQCLNENCSEKKDLKEHSIQHSTNCLEGWTCGECGYQSVTGAAGHNFEGAPYMHDETAHWQECENGICTVTSTPESHYGGTATCRDQAVCEVCGTAYGSLDKTSHTGGVQREAGHVDPTAEKEGYTGDTICLGCGEIIEKGTVIPRLEPEHTHTWAKNYDDLKSWEECTCGAVQNETAHKLSEWKYDKEAHWRTCDSCEYTTTKSVHAMDEADEDCTTAVYCKDCGYEMVEAQEHRYESYAFDGENHWQVCVNDGCSMKTVPAAHTAVHDNDCSTPLICEVCGYTMLAANTHNYSGPWKADADGHYHECLNTDCEQIEREGHQAVEDDHLCTTPVICTVCNFEMEKGADEHNYGSSYVAASAGHYQQCQNKGCINNSPEVPHSGGTATCIQQAVCGICGNPYGGKNSENHVGEIEIRNAKEPTAAENGYTGDKYCLACGNIVEKGEEIPAEEPEPSETPTPEPVETPTPEPVETPTPEPVETPTPEPVETPTPEPVETPTPEPVETPTPEPVETPTPEPVETPTPEPVETPTPEPVETPTPEPVETPTPEPVETPTPTPVETPTPTPSGTPTPSVTPSVTPAPGSRVPVKQCEVTIPSRTSFAGEDTKADITIVWDGAVLVEGVDYTLEFSKNSDLGMAVVVITGTGAFKGTIRKTFKIVPQAPVVQSTVIRDDRTVKVTWNPVEDAKTYRLYYKGGNITEWTLIAKGIKGSSYVHTFDALEAGADYVYAVQAVHDKNISELSAETQSARPAPAAVEAKKPAPVIKGLKLTWNKVAGADGYVIQRKENGRWVTIKTIKKAGKSAFTDTAVEPGKTYRYRIRAYRIVDKKKVYGTFSGVLTGKK